MKVSHMKVSQVEATNRWRSKKLNENYKWVTWFIPVEIKDKMMEFKKYLMSEYHRKRIQANQ